MLVTEADAKKLWCPAARTAWAMNANNEKPPICTANRGNTDDQCRCIASGCMWWRWNDTVKAFIKDTDEPAKERTAYTVGDLEIRHSREVGYCGMAGRPDEP